MNPQIEQAYSLIEDMNGDGLITDADRDIYKKQTEIDLKHCLFVIFVDPNSPAYDAGIREADILTEFNGVPVSKMDELLNQIDKYRVGDTVTLQWMRRDRGMGSACCGCGDRVFGQRDEAKAKAEQGLPKGQSQSRRVDILNLTEPGSRDCVEIMDMKPRGPGLLE